MLVHFVSFGDKTLSTFVNTAKPQTTTTRQEVYVHYVTVGSILVTIVAVEKQYYIFVCVCVRVRVGGWVHVRLALLIEHATRVRHIVSSFVASSSITFFNIIS